MDEKKGIKALDIFTSIPVILILLCFCFPISCALTVVRLVRMKERERSYKIRTIILSVITFGTLALTIGVITVTMIQQSRWDKEYQAYIDSEDYVAAEKMLDEKKSGSLTEGLAESYLELFRISGQVKKMAEIVQEYYDGLEDKTLFGEDIQNKLEELRPEMDEDTRKAIDGVLAQVEAAREEKVQESIEESKALIAKQQSEEASKAAEESSKEAAKEAEASSEAASKAAEASSIAAEEESKKEAEEAGKRAQEETEREEQIQEAIADINSYIEASSNSVFKRIQKTDEEIFDEAWKSSFAAAIENERDWTEGVKDKAAAYCSLYQESHGDSISKDAQDIMESLNTLSQYDTEIQQLKSKYDGLDLETDTVLYGTFYITQRLGSAEGDTIIDGIRRGIGSSNENGSQWVAYNVEYLYGTAFPGDNIYILQSSQVDPFTESGEYTIAYVDTGTFKKVVDDKGFQQDVPLYKIVEDYDQMIADSNEVRGLEQMISQEYAGMRSRILKGGGKELTADQAAEKFSGEWWDLYSQRCHMTITPGENGTLNIVIDWGSSAWENTQWSMSGTYDSSTGNLEYYDCVETDQIYDDNGNVTNNIVYSGGTGRLYIVDDYLYWQDDMENQGDQCYFERSQE